jgi:hypothetical protein
MSASRTKTIRLSHALYEGIELMAKQQGYPTATALFEGMARYALLTQAKHAVTLPWAHLPPAVQDQLDAALLVLLIARRGMKAAEAAVITVDEILAMAEKVKAANPDLFKE